MGKVQVTLRKPDTIRVVGGAADKAVYKAATRVRGYAQSNVRAAGRVNTGAMVRGIQARRGTSGALRKMYLVTSSAPYSNFQEEGTRAHGPRRAKFMVFTPKGGGGIVFAKWVRGVVGAHFMRNAARRIRASDFV